MIKKLASHIGQYKKDTILTPIYVAGEAVIEVIIPYIMSLVINKGIGNDGNSNLRFVFIYGGLMVLMSVISLFFGAMSGKHCAIASAGFATNLRNALFNKVQDFSFANTDKFSTASLITRLTTDVTNVQQSFMMLIRMFVRAPIMLITAMIMAFRLNSQIAIVFVVAIPVLIIPLAIIFKSVYPRFRVMFKKYDKMNSDIQENLIGARVVKSFVREDYEIEKMKKSSEDIRRTMIGAEKILLLNNPLMMLAMYGTIIAIVWLSGKQIVFGSMDTGDLSSLIAYVMQILMSLMMISMVFVMVVMSRASAARICEVLDEKLDITDENITPGLKVENGEIIFRNVEFNYGKKEDEEENKVLSGINLTIKSGETIGIIGGTGSSKTSLVQLIPRLYDVESGEVIVSGHNVKEYPLKELRDSVAMVLQKNVLFSGTIMENLRWGDENATAEEIEDACKSAQAHDFITSFPNGYNTDLGQGGVNVSGGQKQRLCIARALLKKPKIMILDDSTSAVDSATDANIRAAFKNKIADTTLIIIAQRINSVMDSDKIIVMDNGRINAVGTHDELLANNEIYREVFTSQQKGSEA